jgi:hypothetical protein
MGFVQMKGFLGRECSTSVLLLVIGVSSFVLALVGAVTSRPSIASETEPEQKGQMQIASNHALSVYGGFTSDGTMFKTSVARVGGTTTQVAMQTARESAKGTCEAALQGCWEMGTTSGNECIAYAVANERLWLDTGTMAKLHSSHGAYPNYAVLCPNGQAHVQLLDNANADFSGLQGLVWR